MPASLVHEARDRQRLTALGFLALQRFPVRGVHFTRACPALFVPLSGFGYPLSGFLLPKPLNHLSGSSVPGVNPSELFSLQRAVPLSRPPALLPFGRLLQPRLNHAWGGYRALFPLKSRDRRSTGLMNTGALALLGFCISEAFSLLTLSAPSSRRLLCTFCSVTSNSARCSRD
jgi:hypothetical protein